MAVDDDDDDDNDDDGISIGETWIVLVFRTSDRCDEMVVL